MPVYWMCAYFKIFNNIDWSVLLYDVIVPSFCRIIFALPWSIIFFLIIFCWCKLQIVQLLYQAVFKVVWFYKSHWWLGAPRLSDLGTDNDKWSSWWIDQTWHRSFFERIWTELQISLCYILRSSISNTRLPWWCQVHIIV